jgi:hypothetical protein
MFYRIQESLRIKEIGKYPQVITADYKSRVDADNFIGNINLKKAPLDVVVPNPILQKRSKLTDLISAVPMGFNLKLLVSTKLRDILLSYRSDGLEFLSAPIIENDNLIDDYYILNFYENNQEFIDFQNSEVLTVKKDFDKNFIESKIEIKTLDEMVGLLSQKKEFGIVRCWINRVSIDESVVNKDLFVLTNVFGNLGYYISEELKVSIEESGCTGIDLIPSKMTASEWRDRKV